MYEEYLMHYGVKGMKWGVRRVKDKGKKILKNASAEARERSSRLRKSVNRRTLDSKDLTKAIERLKMEKELKNLTEEDLSPGKHYVKGVLRKTADKVIPVVAAGTAMYLVKQGIEKKWGKEASSYIAPNIFKKK